VFLYFSGTKRIASSMTALVAGRASSSIERNHDVNDYMLGEKYGLETIDIFNDDGTINDKVGMYVGGVTFSAPVPNSISTYSSRITGIERFTSGTMTRASTGREA